MTTERPFSPELWEHTPAAVQDSIHALEARVAALKAIVQRLEAVVQHVTERRQQDSRPPSSAPPQATAKWPRREPSGCRPGGQPGHEG